MKEIQKKDVRRHLECFSPIHFGSEKEYLDFIISRTIFSKIGKIKPKEHGRIKDEFKKKFMQEIESYFLEF